MTQKMAKVEMAAWKLETEQMWLHLYACVFVYVSVGGCLFLHVCM